MDKIILKHGEYNRTLHSYSSVNLLIMGGEIHINIHWTGDIFFTDMQYLSCHNCSITLVIECCDSYRYMSMLYNWEEC